MSKAFENEVFEDDGCVPELVNGTAAWDAARAEEFARLTTEDPHGIHVADKENIVFDKKTGEVIEGPATPAVRIAASSVSYDAKGAQTTAKKGAPVRTKRTEAQMIASLGGSALKEATYVAERIAKLEDKISELMGAVGQKAREHVLNDYPHLSRY